MWIWVMIDLISFFFFWVVIEGVRGNGYYGDIVIDDVFFISGCKLIIGFFS